MKKHAISVEMAGRIMESFSDAWSGKVLDELKALIAQQSETQEDTSGCAGLQDFTANGGVNWSLAQLEYISLSF